MDKVHRFSAGGERGRRRAGEGREGQGARRTPSQNNTFKNHASRQSRPIFVEILQEHKKTHGVQQVVSVIPFTRRLDCTYCTDSQPQQLKQLIASTGAVKSISDTGRWERRSIRLLGAVSYYADVAMLSMARRSWHRYSVVCDFRCHIVIRPFCPTALSEHPVSVLIPRRMHRHKNNAGAQIAVKQRNRDNRKLVPGRG